MSTTPRNAPKVPRASRAKAVVPKTPQEVAVESLATLTEEQRSAIVDFVLNHPEVCEVGRTVLRVLSLPVPQPVRGFVIYFNALIPETNLDGDDSNGYRRLSTGDGDLFVVLSEAVDTFFGTTGTTVDVDACDLNTWLV